MAHRIMRNFDPTGPIPVTTVLSPGLSVPIPVTTFFIPTQLTCIFAICKPCFEHFIPYLSSLKQTKTLRDLTNPFFIT